MKRLEAIIEKNQGKKHKSLRRIGGGYYADVYKVNYENAESVVVKVYKTKGVMEKERESLKLLSEHSIAPVPSALWTYKSDEDYDRDILAMNYLDGTVGGAVYYLSKVKRKKLADSVAENLIAFHKVISPDGFGEIGSSIRYKTFNEYYKIQAEKILPMAEELEGRGQLTSFAVETMRRALERFDRIFYLPITEAVLIHGDYNMWNILVDRKECTVSAVIDPCGCMWADSEYDLYQLNNANGRKLGLFESYASKRKLSENCLEKMAFYELFNSVEHYYMSGHPVRKRKMDRRTKELKKYLEV